MQTLENEEHRLPQAEKSTAMTAGTMRLEHGAPTSGAAIGRDETQRPGAAPNNAAGVVLAPPRRSLPVSSGVPPHLAAALRAAAASNVAARIRTTAVNGSAPGIAGRPSRAAAASGSTGRGLSVAEAAAAARISFRPLRRPFGRLPYGAPWHDLEPLVVVPLAGDPSPPEPAGASAPSQAEAPARVARTIAALEKLRRAARLAGEQPQVLLAEARA
jgi:hypothetical protein